MAAAVGVSAAASAMAAADSAMAAAASAMAASAAAASAMAADLAAASEAGAATTAKATGPTTRPRLRRGPTDEGCGGGDGSGVDYDYGECGTFVTNKTTCRCLVVLFICLISGREGLEEAVKEVT
ncbi:ice-structuring protein 4-like [Eriocheir sinensis]|uniref:ice-structuring protein 4-like n=1 Tax=Eriocheir sinensis TaxID=95602 RepID=UPI0021CAD9CA|nr:ice-structuring protein 4-like [Eriocheir sinensis]